MAPPKRIDLQKDYIKSRCLDWIFTNFSVDWGSLIHLLNTKRPPFKWVPKDVGFHPESNHVLRGAAWGIS